MLKNLRPSLRTLLVHFIALALVLSYRYYFSEQNQSSNVFALTLTEGLIAATLGILAGLRAWWIPINFLFFPLLYIGLNYSINPLWYLAIFSTLWLLNWNAFTEQVPLYLSGKKTINALANQLGKNKPFTFADFGCGLASVLLPLARQFPNAHFIGYETAPLPYLIAKLRSTGISNLDIKRQSFWSTNWNAYDVIYCFLSPAPMPAIATQANQQIRPGAVLVSNTFALPQQAAAKVIEVSDLRKTQLFIYQY
ncbi:MAG: trans-aconitate methyltransferase [Gammaproteobacteria bacterium]|nr:MAG: trans-aconitate methyltransferase [Gammaproteobacteria bacterium]